MRAADVLCSAHCVWRSVAYMYCVRSNRCKGLEMAGFLIKLMPKRFRKEASVIPVVRLQGAIMSGGSQFRPALNLASTAQVLEKAFSYKSAPAVAISINSPGGSPVQSRLIFSRI